MKVYLFSDYLKTIHGDPLQEDQLVCEIGTIDSFPNGLVLIKGKLSKICMLSSSEDCIFIKFMGRLPKKDDIYFSKDITCPQCGNEDRDSWEASDSDDAHGCEDCGSVFSYERNTEVTYSSKIIERNEAVPTLR